jgi:hypothetical protein
MTSEADSNLVISSPTRSSLFSVTSFSPPLSGFSSVQLLGTADLEDVIDRIDDLPNFF